MTFTKEQLTKAARKECRAKLGWDKAHEWKYTEERDSYTAEELERVTALQAQWKSLCEQGEAEGWLYWTNDYSGSHLETEESTLHPTRKIQVKETKAARADRIKEVNDEVEAKVSKLVEKQWKSLQDAQALIDRIGK